MPDKSVADEDVVQTQSLQSNSTEDEDVVQPLAKFWWLNIVRGAAALLLGLGLLLTINRIFEAEQLRTILFQFLGLYLLTSGIMSLIWGFSNRRRLGLWIVAGVLGLLAGIAFIFTPFLILAPPFTIIVALVGVGFIMLLTGLIHIFGGFRLEVTYGRRWSWGHMFLGLIEILIGLLVFISFIVPTEMLRIALSLWGIVAGIGLITDGLSMRRLTLLKQTANSAKTVP